MAEGLDQVMLITEQETMALDVRLRMEMDQEVSNQKVQDQVMMTPKEAIVIPRTAAKLVMTQIVTKKKAPN